MDKGVLQEAQASEQADRVVRGGNTETCSGILTRSHPARLYSPVSASLNASLTFEQGGEVGGHSPKQHWPMLRVHAHRPATHEGLELLR